MRVGPQHARHACYRFLPKRAVREALNAGEHEGELTLEDFGWELAGGGNPQGDLHEIAWDDELGEGPYFTVENQEAAANEARTQAIRNAQARAELYARAAGMRVSRILTITEGGSYYPVARENFIMATATGYTMAPPPPPPAAVHAGEVTLGVSVSVQFALERQ